MARANKSKIERKQAPEERAQSMNELSDEDVLHAIADGALWAMELLYERFSRSFYSLAYHMVNDHHLAEDLVQDAFLSIWRRANLYSPQAGAPHSWLLSIVHHRAIDHLRKIQRRSSIHEAPLEEIELDERFSMPDIWEEVWRSEEQAQVRKALLQLSKEQRTALELAYFHGLTHVEIAERYRLPLGTIKSRLRVGLIHLKQVLGNMSFNEL